MDEQQNSIDKLLHDMRERAKELNCLYQVEELLTKTHLPIAEIFAQLIHVIPAGYQFPEICQVRIVYDDKTYESPDYVPARAPDRQHQDRGQGGRPHRGLLCQESPQTKTDSSRRSRRLLKTIAERIGRTSCT